MVLVSALVLVIVDRTLTCSSTCSRSQTRSRTRTLILTPHRNVLEEVVQLAQTLGCSGTWSIENISLSEITILERGGQEEREGPVQEEREKVVVQEEILEVAVQEERLEVAVQEERQEVEVQVQVQVQVQEEREEVAVQEEIEGRLVQGEEVLMSLNEGEEVLQVPDEWDEEDWEPILEAVTENDDQEDIAEREEHETEDEAVEEPNQDSRGNVEDDVETDLPQTLDLSRSFPSTYTRRGSQNIDTQNSLGPTFGEHESESGQTVPMADTITCVDDIMPPTAELVDMEEDDQEVVELTARQRQQLCRCIDSSFESRIKGQVRNRKSEGNSRNKKSEGNSRNPGGRGQGIALCRRCGRPSRRRGRLLVHRQEVPVLRTRWRGAKFPCDKCSYVACREGNLINHKKSKHEGVMFMDSYITDYFAKSKLIIL